VSVVEEGGHRAVDERKIEREDDGRTERLIIGMDEGAVSRAEEGVLMQRRRRGIQIYPGGPVDRYLPPVDPSRFLVEPDKLTREEQRFQVFFAAFPWLTFLAMLSAPFALVATLLPRLDEKARASLASESEELLRLFRVPEFAIVPFRALVDVIERPLHSLIIFFHRDVFGTYALLPLLVDLARLFRNHNMPVAVVAVDLAGSDVPDTHRKKFPPGLSPFMQVLCPYSQSGEPGLLDHDGPWNAVEIVKTVESQVNIPDTQHVYRDARRLDEITERLTDCLFQLDFIDSDPSMPPEAPPTPPAPTLIQRISSALFGQQRPSDTHPARSADGDGGGVVSDRHGAYGRDGVYVWRGGLEAAHLSCEAAREQLLTEMAARRGGG